MLIYWITFWTIRSKERAFWYTCGQKQCQIYPMYRYTEGITYGAVRKVWNFKTVKTRLPTRPVLNTISGRSVNFSFFLTSLAMKYASLTAEQNHALIEEVTSRNNSHEPLACRVMAPWCQKTFSLESATVKSTVARVVRNTQGILPLHSTTGISKNFKTPYEANSRLEQAMITWVCNHYSLHQMIYGPVMEKEMKFQTQCHGMLLEGKRLTLNISARWLYPLRGVWICDYLEHMDMLGMQTWTRYIKRSLSSSKNFGYSLRETYSTLMSVSFSTSWPPPYSGSQQPPRRKIGKDFITVWLRP